MIDADADADVANPEAGTDIDASPTDIMITLEIREDDKDIMNAFELENQFIVPEKNLYISRRLKKCGIVRE